MIILNVAERSENKIGPLASQGRERWVLDLRIRIYLLDRTGFIRNSADRNTIDYSRGSRGHSSHNNRGGARQRR